jgi:hypothetical protein
VNEEQREKEYEKLMGRAALERQKIEKKTRCWYCGGKDGKHMNLCKNKSNEPRPA